MLNQFQRLSTVGYCLSHRVASSMLHLEGSELHPQINEASDVFFFFLFLFKALFVFQYSSDDAQEFGPSHLLLLFSHKHTILHKDFNSEVKGRCNTSPH